MDLETRLLHCMTTLQGRSREEATKRVFGNENQPSEMEYLSAYVASQSRGFKLAAGHSHPKEKEAYELGKALFFHRAGGWDMSCASCHGEEDKRIRMQDLPVLSKPQFARPIMATWPAYRVSNSQFKTMQWRINDCYRQMRYPGARSSPPTPPSRSTPSSPSPPPASPTAARGPSDETRSAAHCARLFRGGHSRKPLAQDVQKVLQRDFQARGQATMDRVVQDGAAARVHRHQRPAAGATSPGSSKPTR